MTELSNSLADLAERIREANAAVLVAERTTAENALVAGRLLCQAKEECVHGEWMPFLARAGVHDRQARRLMQLARSGLDIGHVSDLGGIKGALEHLATRLLPEPDEVVFVCRETAGLANPDAEWIACILPSEVKGHFDVTVIGPAGCSFSTTGRPVQAETTRLHDGGYFNVLWETIAREMPVLMAEWSFTAAPIYLLLDDCSFLADLIENPSDPGKTALPLSYAGMIEALERCVSDFSLESYFRARRAQKLCMMQMEKWPSDDRMMSVYTQIAQNDHHATLARRVDELARERLAA